MVWSTHWPRRQKDPAEPARSTLRRLGRGLAAAAILVLAWIGFLHLTRGTAVRHVRGVSIDAPIGVGEPQFPLAVTMLTGAWIVPGHRVEVMLDGEGTYDRLWSDLRAARESITLQVYYGNSGRMARALGDILRGRVAAGVRVVLLYDAFGTAGIPEDHIDALRAAGVQVEPFRPLRVSTLHLAQHRSHVRGIVIDGRIGWTGGFGIDDKWFGDGRTHGAWRETNVRFEGPAVRRCSRRVSASTSGSRRHSMPRRSWSMVNGRRLGPSTSTIDRWP